jgi:hypothetical protein
MAQAGLASVRVGVLTWLRQWTTGSTAGLLRRPPAPARRRLGAPLLAEARAATAPARPKLIGRVIRVRALWAAQCAAIGSAQSVYRDAAPIRPSVHATARPAPKSARRPGARFLRGRAARRTAGSARLPQNRTTPTVTSSNATSPMAPEPLLEGSRVLPFPHSPGRRPAG